MNTLFGVKFTPMSEQELLSTLSSDPPPSGFGVRRVFTANVDHIVNLQGNGKFMAAYLSSWAVTADGAPVYLYAKLIGAKIPCRITGADLFSKLMQKLSPEQARCFFVA